jgi:DNA polymerase-3 subunit epsilon
MISLAHSLDVIQTATIIEAEVRELRLISEKQPRFNRRSKFQAKSLWIKLTKEAFPRLVAIRGAKGLDDESGWAGPFNGRDESARAIEALYEVTQIRQCKPRITLASMKNASPCALFDMKRCGAPCIGQKSIDSYSSHVTAIHQSLHIDSRPILNSLNERMKELANQERFEEAAEVRNRLGALIRGSARAQSIRSLTRVKELIAAIATSIDTWEFVVIRHGKLAASATAKSDNYKEVVQSLKLTAEVVIDNGEILPASHHEEVEVLLRYLNQEGIRIVEIDGIWALPTFGSAAARSEIEKVRAQVGANSYKEDFANSVDRFAQRSTN